MSSATISIPKKEYDELRRIKSSFETVQRVFVQTTLVVPSKKIDWGHLPTEDSASYKPSFVKKSARPLRKPDAENSRPLTLLRAYEAVAANAVIFT